MPAQVAVTGASGFIGTALTQTLTEFGHETVPLTRGADSRISQLIRVDYQSRADLVAKLAGCDVLVHLAGIAHSKASKDTLHAGNVELTRVLAQAARDAGIKQFIYLSSIKAMGETTATGAPFTAHSPCNPEDEYGKTKLEAEQTAAAIMAAANRQWTVIRPPLVYDVTALGNIQRLRQMIERGKRVPVGGVNNRRSLITRRNLCRLICYCVDNPKAYTQTFLAGEREPFSTAQLAQKLAHDLNQTAKITIAPELVRSAMKRLPKARDLHQKLFGDLEVDIAHTCTTLNWAPEA